MQSLSAVILGFSRGVLAKSGEHTPGALAASFAEAEFVNRQGAVRQQTAQHVDSRAYLQRAAAEMGGTQRRLREEERTQLRAAREQELAAKAAVVRTRRELAESSRV